MSRSPCCTGATSARLSATTLIAAALLTFIGCSREAVGPDHTPAAGPAAEVRAAPQPLIFSVAASTKEAIEALTEKFHEKSGAEVKVNPGPSSGLANQVIAGAPADLFLSASRQWAEEVSKHDKVSMIVPLLTNELVLVVPAANPGGVNAPQDLLSPAVKKVALAGEKVPAGTYADQALTKLGLLEPLVAAGKIVRGQDVRSALSYVERGEAEAGIVYSTDVGAATGLKTVHPFDPQLHDEIVYVLALLKNADANPQAKEFYEFLQSADAEATYAQFGFSRLH